MKKKISFSLMNYFDDIQSDVVGIQTKVKALFATLAGFSYISSNDKYTLLVVIAGFIINELLACIRIEYDTKGI